MRMVLSDPPMEGCNDLANHVFAHIATNESGAFRSLQDKVIATSLPHTSTASPGISTAWNTGTWMLRPSEAV